MSDIVEPTEIEVAYFGGMARQNRLDIYDYSRSISGVARLAAILAEFYVSGRVISQAPSSSVDFYISAAEQGSFKQTLAGAIIGGICVSSFDVVFSRILNRWLPEPDANAELIIAEQKKQTEILEKVLAQLSVDVVNGQSDDVVVADKFLEEKEKELSVLRSITANSFKDVFRPVGRSCEYSTVRAGSGRPPSKFVSPRTAAIIESDRHDNRVRTINARVTGFTRGSKKGLCFSEALGHGFRFEYKGVEGKLPDRDIFSWSQFEQEEIVMEGSFVYFFDGGIKKFLVYFASKKDGSSSTGEHSADED